jgi:hypothetical protein
LNTVDHFSSTGFYDQSFASEEFAQSQYRRFWKMGSHFMATDHSFAFGGFRNTDEVELEQPRWGFAERLIHSKHMPELYRRMFMVVQFQHLGLEDEAQSLPAEEDSGAILHARKRWVLLRNKRWFNRISTQLQGNEIFQLMRRRMSIDEDMQLLGKKLEDLERVIALEDSNQIKLAEQSAERGRDVLRLFGFPVATFVTLRTAFDAGKGLDGTSWSSYFDKLATLFAVSDEASLLISLSCLISALLTLLHIKFTTIENKHEKPSYRVALLLAFIGIVALGLSYELPNWFNGNFIPSPV